MWLPVPGDVLYVLRCSLLWFSSRLPPLCGGIWSHGLWTLPNKNGCFFTALTLKCPEATLADTWVGRCRDDYTPEGGQLWHFVKTLLPLLWFLKFISLGI